MTAKEKMTAPIASVGADVEQPSSNKLTNQSIADLPGKGNLQATNNAENAAKSANKKNTDDLETVSMMELYDTAYPPKLPIIDGLLYNGTYLFRSFFYFCIFICQIRCFTCLTFAAFFSVHNTSAAHRNDQGYCQQSCCFFIFSRSEERRVG